MSKSNPISAVDVHFRKSAWKRAQALLETELANTPNDHWVMTQLGVTHYEQRKYKTALRFFRASEAIVADCPLTLWNLAGTLDALGKYVDAIGIYVRLLECSVSPDADPCWESKQWAKNLKNDCVYRLGVCFQHLAKNGNGSRINAARQLTRPARSTLQALTNGKSRTLA